MQSRLHQNWLHIPAGEPIELQIPVGTLVKDADGQSALLRSALFRRVYGLEALARSSRSEFNSDPKLSSNCR